jgi:hypothetical protein
VAAAGCATSTEPTAPDATTNVVQTIARNQSEHRRIRRTLAAQLRDSRADRRYRCRHVPPG